ncbi:MAG: hypothetical protein KY432_05000 [Acidobacteria bacterium]|nr:hypothetical protein [Acidobacteriota bacterium]
MKEIDCNTAHEEIDRLFSGELTGAPSATVLSHLDRCVSCHEHYSLVEQIASAAAPEPDPAELLSMRRQVLRTIRTSEGRDWLAFFRFRLPAFAVAPLVVLVMAGGFLLGRNSGSEPEHRETAVAESGGGEIVLARQIHLVAQQNRDLDDVESSPFRYSNVQIREGEGDLIDLSFDVSRHLDLTLPKHDPLVTEVLVQSVLDPGSVGTQINAISRADNILDPRIRGALIRAMLHDPNLGVRIQAQSKLIERPGDDGIAAALLTVLEREESVQMRLVAIDYLAQTNVPRQRVEQAVEAGEPEGRTAVAVRARSQIQSF